MRFTTIAIILILQIRLLTPGQAQDDVMLQGFYWDVPVDSEHTNGFWYDTLSSKMEMLRQTGFTEIWLPPPSKGNWGIYDVGYGIYDHYDLGAYDQINTIETRYGSYGELRSLIRQAHDTSTGPPIHLLADIVLNQMYSTQLKDYEVNPVLKDYILNEAEVDGQQHHPYPVNESIWQISPNGATSLAFILKCYESDQPDDWNRAFTLELDTSLPSLLSTQRDVPDELASGNLLTAPGYYAGQFQALDELIRLSVELPAGRKLYVRISARQKKGDEYAWTDQARGLYICNAKAAGATIFDRVNVLTTTGIHYVHKAGLPNLTWNYSFFHPGFIGDFLSAAPVDDRVTPAIKWYGHDLNHENPELLSRMVAWGRWLQDSIGYDGYRFDFVMGVDEAFIANWINGVWQQKEQQATMVAEYFTKYKQRIREWAEYMDRKCPRAQTKMFDFPLKFELNNMCESVPEDYDMRNLLYAGMLFDTLNALPADRLVSFVDNHDTGKESDKWLTRNWVMAYAYIFFAPSEPCVFYNHFFGITEKDFSREGRELDIPADLGADITKLMKIRKEYLGGAMIHVSDNSDTYRNFYVAFREGNNACTGAFLTLSNKKDQDIPELILNKDLDHFFGKELTNLLHPSQSVRVSQSGAVKFPMKGHTEGIWILKEDKR